MKRLLAIPFFLVLVGMLGIADLRAQTTTAVSYDTFMKLDVSARSQKFQELSPANQADIQREQLVRWRRLNADRLTNEQHQILAEIAAFIRPDFYESKRQDDSVVAKLLALEEQTGKAFTRQELSEFNTIYSPYIPPQP